MIVMRDWWRWLVAFLHLPQRPLVGVLQLIDAAEHSKVHALVDGDKLVVGRHSLRRGAEKLWQCVSIDVWRVVCLDPEQRLEVVSIGIFGSSLQRHKVRKSRKIL